MTSSPDGLEGEILRTFLSEINEAETIDAEVTEIIEEQAEYDDFGGRDVIADGVLEAVKMDED